ncbi:DUF4253 domain-containing protein [Gorillibacterium sp. CAU 1737]|uniref:DUF4253 domain-containing protein n=1 Tax=Gorillibacterium sp. CAU 1737 TaxID=3140362 RepID=UPI0032606552
MWLFFGILLAFVYILITNQSRKKKVKKKKTEVKPQGKQPIVPVRWTPDLSAETEQEAGMARLSTSKEAYTPEELEAARAEEEAALREQLENREREQDEREDGDERDEPAEEPASTALEPTVDEIEAELELPVSPRPDIPAAELLGDERIHSIWEAGRALEKLAGTPARSYMTFDFGTRKYPQEAISVIADEDLGRDWVDALQDRLEGELVAFIGTTRWRGEVREEGVEVVVARGETPFDILRLAQTDAANYDLSTEDIITKLKELDRRYGIRIYAAETECVGFELLKQPSDIEAFAEELYAFCPDLVDQGVGTMEQLIAYLKEDRYLHLWWD